MDHRKPTMKDVAVAAGVSISTVSHVLNGTRFVSAGATAKVHKAIGHLQFKANPIARNLRCGRSRLIGFVVSNLESYFYVNIARGIEQVVNDLGYQLMLIDSMERKEAESKNIESLYMRGADGIIVAPTKTDCAYLEALVPLDFPLVFVDRPPGNYSADCVLLDNEDAAHRAAAYLLSKKGGRTAFVAYHYGEDKIDETMTGRINGFKRAYREAGLDLNPAYIRAAPGGSAAVSELRHAETYHIMEELLEASVGAVLCGNSLAAIGVFTCLRDRGVPIPQGVSLLTFDDDLWLSMTSPRISAVVQPAESMGATAALRLLKRIQGEALPRESLRLKAEILFRESC